MSRSTRKSASSGRRKPASPKVPRSRRPRQVVRQKTRDTAGPIEVAQADTLRAEMERLVRSAGPSRWNANPDDVQRSVVKLVLTIVEFLRQLLERQAIRRMDAGTISAEETERIGIALMRLEETVRELAAQFNLTPEDLNLDLGGVGRLI